MSDSDWDAMIDAFYAEQFDEADAEGSVARMRELVSAHPGPLADYEIGGVYDSLGNEADAVPLYRAALAGGLDAVHAGRCRIQLASSLRNLDRADEAVEILTGPTGTDDDSARAAFLALALHSAGRSAEALRVALEALAPTLPRYRRAVVAYADELAPGDGASAS